MAHSGDGVSVRILPVIHYADDAQALRNAERAFEAGCDGVMLIEMRGRNWHLPAAASAIKARWPDRKVGLNFLNTCSVDELPFNLCPDFDMTWTDEQLTHSSSSPWWDARRAQQRLGQRPGHSLFCGVAFKYQQAETNPALAARKAVQFGFIPTTSGPATGAAADPSAIRVIRDALAPTDPLAIASGITPENAEAFLPLVSHILVSTGVSASFHEFDPQRLRALVDVRDKAA